MRTKQPAKGVFNFKTTESYVTTKNHPTKYHSRTLFLTKKFCINPLELLKHYFFLQRCKLKEALSKNFVNSPSKTWVGSIY